MNRKNIGVVAMGSCGAMLFAAAGQAQIAFDNSCGNLRWTGGCCNFVPPATCFCENNWATGTVTSPDCHAGPAYPGSGDDAYVGIAGTRNDMYAELRSVVVDAPFTNEYLIYVATTGGYHGNVESHGGYGGNGVHSFFSTMNAYSGTTFLWPCRAHFYGAVDIPATGSMEIDAEVFNHSTMTWTGPSFYIDGAYGGGTLAVLRILQGASLIATTDAEVRGIIGLGHMENSGLFRKDGGTGTTQISVEFTNRPTGVIDVRTGTARFQQELNLQGTATIAAGCVMECANVTNIPTTFGSSGAGLFMVSSNFNLSPGATAAIVHFDSDPSQSTSLIAGAGTINISSTANLGGRWAGTNTVNLLHGCTTTVHPHVFEAQEPTTFNNHGNFTWSENHMAFAAGASINNASDGVFEIQNDWAMTGYGFSGEGTCRNAGVMRKTVGTRSQILIPFYNSGRLECSTGAIAFPHFHQTAGETVLMGGGLDGDYQVEPLRFEGGTLRGSGLVKGPVLNSGGTISPGNSAGTITIGGAFYGNDFTQTAGGTLDIEIGGTAPGTEFDQLVVDGSNSFGSVTLGGTLRVRFINGFAPYSGSFDVIVQNSTGAVSGTFATVDAPAGCTVRYFADRVEVHYSSCPADFNDDMVVDFFDYLDFVDAFSGNIPIADYNGDTVIDFFDYLDFVDAFSTGC